MRVAGLDSSGNLEYIGMVVGEAHLIKRVHRRLLRKYGKLHGRELTSDRRKALVVEVLLCELEFYCLRVGYREVLGRARAALGRAPGRRLRRALDRAIAAVLLELLNSAGVDRIEADVELEPVLSSVGVRVRKGRASELADSVARANYMGLKVPKLREQDVREDLLESLIRVVK